MSLAIPGFVLILLSLVLVNHFVLLRLLHTPPFLGVVQQPQLLFAITLTTTFALTLSALIGNGMNQVLLPGAPAVACMLSLIITMVGLNYAIKTFRPKLTPALPHLVPLIFINVWVLGLAQLEVIHHLHPLYALATGLIFSALWILFRLQQQRISELDVPMIFRGAPMALITASLMSLALMALTMVNPT